MLSHIFAQQSIKLGLPLMLCDALHPSLGCSHIITKRASRFKSGLSLRRVPATDSDIFPVHTRNPSDRIIILTFFISHCPTVPFFLLPQSFHLLPPPLINPRKLLTSSQDIQAGALQFRFAWRYDNEDIRICRKPGQNEIEARSFDDVFGKMVHRR